MDTARPQPTDASGPAISAHGSLDPEKQEILIVILTAASRRINVSELLSTHGENSSWEVGQANSFLHHTLEASYTHCHKC
jgi:hypothetical protein